MKRNSVLSRISGMQANKRKLGVLADLPVYDIPYPQIKEIAALKNLAKLVDRQAQRNMLYFL